MKLHILASGKKAKGIQLERLTQRILEHIGYEYVNTNKIGAGGDEIDVDAKYVLPQPVENSVYRVICECKAHEKPITIDDWDKFIGKVYKYDRNGLTMGLMIALSDANGNVKGDINDCNTNIKGFVFEKLGVRDVKRNISVNIVDNSGFETTINAQKRLFYLHAQDSNSGVVCMALDDFEGKYNKETDSVEPTSYHDNSRYEHLGTII